MYSRRYLVTYQSQFFLTDFSVGISVKNDEGFFEFLAIFRTSLRRHDVDYASFVVVVVVLCITQIEIDSKYLLNDDVLSSDEPSECVCLPSLALLQPEAAADPFSAAASQSAVLLLSTAAAGPFAQVRRRLNKNRRHFESSHCWYMFSQYILKISRLVARFLCDRHSPARVKHTCYSTRYFRF